MELDTKSWWILDLLARFRVPFRLLAMPREDLRLQWNRPAIDCDETAVAEYLIRLQCDGLVQLWAASDQHVSASQRDDRDFAARHRRRFGDTYSLTPEGGRLWEEWAGPNWARFFDDEYCEDPTDDKEDQDDRPEDMILRAGSLERLWDVIDRYPKWWGKRIVDTTSLHVVDESPFEATYWKQLTRGYSCRFGVVRDWDTVRNERTAEGLWLWTTRGFSALEAAVVVPIEQSD